MVPVLCFVGRSNSGKTTLLEKLVPLLSAHSYRLALVKHTQHEHVETDLPGTDTRRLWDTGVVHTAFLTPDRVVHTHRHAAEPPLEEVLARIYGVDLILVEGYKGGAWPKIEVVRAKRDSGELEKSTLIPDLQGRIACVSDVSDLPFDGPYFELSDVGVLADFIASYARAMVSIADNGDRGERWQEIDHTADLALHLWGDDLSNLFMTAARGMFSLIAEVELDQPVCVEKVTLEALDAEALLVDWLNELLYLSEVHGMAFVAFDLKLVEQTSLQATVLGFPIQRSLNYIKAATFHNLEITKTDRGYETEIVFDT